MPELPEVETVVRGLQPQLVGARIKGVWTDWPKVIAGDTPQGLAAALDGAVINDVRRRGKYIIIVTSHGMVVIHLRMTGRLYVSSEKTGHDPWVHFSLGLGPLGFLAFSDARKFGRVTLMSNLNPIEAKLGPEPLTLSGSKFERLMTNSNASIKSRLLNQSVIAGVGNIYADESLFRAGIHPKRVSSTLAPDESRTLGRVLKKVLKDAIDHEGASISWYRKPDGTTGSSQNHFRVYGKKGQPCTVCDTPIERMVIAQRGTHYCPQCQPCP